MKSAAFASQPANWECEGQALLSYHKTGQLHLQVMSQPIGPFYERFGNRLLTYLLMASGLICGVFLALGFAGGSGFLLQHLPLCSILALYLALVFTFSHVLADVAAHYLWPRGMAYGSRSVGKQWIVLFSGLALGFWVHWSAFGELMQLCGPITVGRLPIDLPVTPLWCATLYACLFMVFMSHNQTGGERAAEPGPGAGDLPQDKPIRVDAAASAPTPAAPPATVSFRINGRHVNIPVRDISHVCMEDHYCRVYYRGSRGLQDFLVRETLKGLTSRIGPEDFMQIHRSHLVNKKHVVGFKRKGRKHWLLLGPSRAALSISQRRQAQVKAALSYNLDL